VTAPAGPPAHRPLALIGAPLELGAGRRGCAMGPAALRTAEIAETLIELGYRVHDLGDVAPLPADPALTANPPKGRANHLVEIAGWSQALSERVRKTLAQGDMPIILGGDHALSMGSVNGVASHCKSIGRELFVLWLDAHADFNTPETSPSGNVHGMPVAMLCREPGLDGVMGAIERVSVRPQNVHLFGIRSVDRGERALLAARGIHVVDMRLIDEFGVVSLLKSILTEVQSRDGLLHVSLDVDFLDPSLAPGVGTAVPGGATYREAHLIMEMLHDSGLVASLDIVELNPFLDERGRSAKILVDLASSLFGRRIVDRPQAHS
jgi:arginase